LRADGSLDFDKLFHEPLGYYLLKCFLVSNLSVDKAVFVSDIETYKKLRDPSARHKFANLICNRYLTEQTLGGNQEGTSVFDRHPTSDVTIPFRERTDSLLQLQKQPMNALGVSENFISDIIQDVQKGANSIDVFNPILEIVLRDLRQDVYPRFLKSQFFRRFIQCKTLETKRVDKDDFDTRRVLGRGAFGYVNMCVKSDTGKSYAMKCINKKRVKANESVSTIMSERNFLSKMQSKFVICLKYAVMDENSLYLVLDLREGGDLKFHLNKDELFSEERARFHAAEVLLGLEHIHSHGIIYRDMKLENILLDRKGHCSLSDLGLAVKSEKVKGYAGTPGYTAPEVVSQLPYDKRADFFSYGVMVFRFICGKKPFAVRGRQRKKQNRKGRSELDQNVLQMNPEYQDKYFSPRCKDFLQKLLHKDPDKRMGRNGIIEIKAHPWFEEIDFGMLEAKYLDPPFVPNLDEVNADCLRHISRPPQDDRFKAVKLTPEFESKLAQFPYRSKKAIQEEIVEVLQKNDESANYEDSTNPLDLHDRESSKLCCVLQ